MIEHRRKNHHVIIFCIFAGNHINTTMKTYTIPFLFSMNDCPWFSMDDTGEPRTTQVDLTDEEAAQLADLVRNNSGERDAVKLNMETVLPELYKKLDDAVKAVCQRLSYCNALINEFIENGAHYDADTEKVMAALEADGLFNYDPAEPGTDPDKVNEFGIWAEEYFFDLPTDEDRVQFIEKYYDYTICRLNGAKLAYGYSFFVPEGV